MPLSHGTRIGPYEVAAQIGAGGMGEVYRATDTNLKRAVAIKVLPASVAGDAERLARFQREAEVLAALNHPHIAQIHGLERADGLTALVMELVDGPTLADRIAAGPLPMDEALPIARQIAEALEAAHEQGIIHRDLKPANIKVRDDGTVKVLDFGLAKAMEPLAASSNASQLPTITTPAMTQAGMILGTAAYMSPEQAKGRPVDRRTDVWAFGAVLFEMLTGTRAFGGDDVSDTLASVLRSEPAWDRLPADTPQSARRLLRRCLTKDVAHRLPDIGSARLEIDDARADSPEAANREPKPGASPSRRRWRAVAAAAGLVFLAATGTALYRSPSATGGGDPPVRLEFSTGPRGQTLGLGFALSPDGTRLVYFSGGRWWLRDLEVETARPVPGTEAFRAASLRPAWSPDGRSLLIETADGLKRVDVDRGSVRTVATVLNLVGFTWGARDTIVFARTAGPLMRVGAAGGEPVAATELARGHVAHRFPSFLPDGRHFVFLAVGTPETRGVYLGSLDSFAITKLFHSDSSATIAPPDSVLFMRDGALLAQRLDIERATLVGEAVPLATSVLTASGNFNATAVSASATGRLAYRARGPLFQLTWFDRAGRRIGALGERLSFQAAQSSRDGSLVSLQIERNGSVDIWSMDTALGTLRRLTSDLYRDQIGAWSPDGRRMAFSSERNGVYDIFEKAADGSGEELPLLASQEPKLVRDWSPDGRFLLYRLQTQATGDDVMALALQGDRKQFPVVQTQYDETGGEFSPDGRWVSYLSDESGRSELYVRPFPGPGGAIQVSVGGGGGFPMWRFDGRELYYRAPDSRTIAVPVATDGARFIAGTPVPLFGGADPGPVIAVSADGQRFLVAETAEDLPPITVLLNWQALLR